ncbi:MAG: hypothetical protein KGI49_01960 [Patescibacteria group bacterium]|nr:hypothetical protein [Patescibacteria group bacterium]
MNKNWQRGFSFAAMIAAIAAFFGFAHVATDKIQATSTVSTSASTASDLSSSGQLNSSTVSTNNCPDGIIRMTIDGPHCVPLKSSDEMSNTSTDNNSSMWYSESSFGFSFPYPSTWQISKRGNVISIVTNDSDLRTITVTEIASSTMDDSTGKWGTYILHANQNGNGWLVTRASERDGSLNDISIVPIQSTNGGYPIFNGGYQSHGWGQFDYVVSLGTSKFLLVRGGESINSLYDPNNDKLLNFVRTITNNN